MIAQSSQTFAFLHDTIIFRLSLPRSIVANRSNYHNAPTEVATDTSVRPTCFSKAYNTPSLSPPGGSTVYELLNRSINHPVANRVTKNDANLALSPTFRYLSIESPL
ncbi:hypothetical protein TNCV_3530581 [Trichonephila clavipes]|nr:hypothetical protein TNCV_3530581 [Trichonephila clavipes]